MIQFINKLPWIDGRQGTGYKKIKLLESKKFLFDCYLLYFPEGSEIPPHRDPVPQGYKHYRLNIFLVKAIEGGIFLCKNTIHSFSRFQLFRPDVEEHSVSKITKGYRLVLSIGWLR